jgi:hypothetical protein
MLGAPPMPMPGQMPMGQPPMGQPPMMGPDASEPVIDLPADTPPATVQKSPEPYELDSSILTADKLLDMLNRAQQGESADRLITESTMPTVRVGFQGGQTPTPGPSAEPLPEPPGSFLRWLTMTDPEQTEGLGRELIDIYKADDSLAPDLWAIVQEGLTGDERDTLPADLKRALKQSSKPVTASGRLSTR